MFASPNHVRRRAARLADRPLDLTAAELRIVYAVPAGTSPNRGMFLGYRGPHGCMVGFWMGTGYALLSKGMDPVRLDRLAEIVARLTDPSRPLDDNTHVALRETNRLGTACRV